MIEDPFKIIGKLFEELKERLEKVESREMPAADPVMDEQTRQQILQYQLLCQKPYLTREEVAVYLDASERSIVEWAQRPHDRNPFPVCAVGSHPRYNRLEVDKWAQREGQKLLMKNAA